MKSTFVSTLILAAILCTSAHAETTVATVVTRNPLADTLSAIVNFPGAEGSVKPFTGDEQRQFDGLFAPQGHDQPETAG